MSSIKDRMKVGQLWKTAKGDVWKITGMGLHRFFYMSVSGIIEHEDLYYCVKSWTMTHDEHGKEVNSKPKVIKVDRLLHRLSASDRRLYLSMAVDNKDYIGWEDDEGHLHGAFRRLKCGSQYILITGEQWESGEWEVVKPVKLLFKGE